MHREGHHLSQLPQKHTSNRTLSLPTEIHCPNDFYGNHFLIFTYIFTTQCTSSSVIKCCRKIEFLVNIYYSII